MSRAGYNKSKSVSIQIVTFRIGSEYFGMSVGDVREIIRGVEMFDVPGSGDDIKGVINLRGEIIPIIRMDRILGIKSKTEGVAQKTRMIIVDSRKGRFGFEVDEVSDVVRVATESVQAPPQLSQDNPLAGVVIGLVQLSGKMILCLDAEKAFSQEVYQKEVSKI